MAEHNDQGTGKHPHKSSEAPWPHREGEDKGEHGRSKQAAAGAGSQGGQSSQRESESSDLKEREYRDAEGNVHHHTKTYEEQHGKEK